MMIEIAPARSVSAAVWAVGVGVSVVAYASEATTDPNERLVATSPLGASALAAALIGDWTCEIDATEDLPPVLSQIVYQSAGDYLDQTVIATSSGDIAITASGRWWVDSARGACVKVEHCEPDAVCGSMIGLIDCNHLAFASGSFSFTETFNDREVICRPAGE